MLIFQRIGPKIEQQSPFLRLSSILWDIPTSSFLKTDLTQGKTHPRRNFHPEHRCPRSGSPWYPQRHSADFSLESGHGKDEKLPYFRCLTLLTFSSSGGSEASFYTYLPIRFSAIKCMFCPSGDRFNHSICLQRPSMSGNKTELFTPC